MKPSAHRLTRCLKCGCVAHYRFEYTLAKNVIGEGTCRACYWREWARETRRLQGGYANLTPIPESQACEHAEAHGYDYLGPLTDPSLHDDPHHVRCRYCQRLSAERLGDIGWGCNCQTNRRRDPAAPSGSTRRAKPNLLKDSGLPVLDWWDHEANDAALWQATTIQARREVSWRCPHCGHQFTKRVLDMVGFRECPECEPKRRAEWTAEYARYKTTAVAAVPELLEAWADETDPHQVTVVGDGQSRRFRCPQGHHPLLLPYTYLKSGCPHCRGQATTEEWLATLEIDPNAYRLNAEIASQWHPTKNGTRQLATVSPGSRKLAWWLDPNCGHEWQASPAEREKGQRLRCPTCRTILDSLAYHFSDLAVEWSPTNPVSAWHVRPSGQTSFTPEWVCATNPQHVWQASLGSRSAGFSGCPECRPNGKSQVELDHHAAAEEVFGEAASGQSVRHDAFVRRPFWLVDITAELPNNHKLAIEYDGAYWHADKAVVDLDKTLDLLAGGYLVARLREHPLPPLPINHPRYAEFVVYSTTPDPRITIARVKHWAMSQQPH